MDEQPVLIKAPEIVIMHALRAVLVALGSGKGEIALLEKAIVEASAAHVVRDVLAARREPEAAND